MELPFLNPVITASLLLRTKLHTVFGSLFAALTVLARRIAAAFKCAFAGVATVALQKELFALTAAKFANRTCISCHKLHLQKLTLFFSWAGGSRCGEWG